MTKDMYSNTSQTQKVAQKSNYRPKNRKSVHKHLTWTESLKQALLLISKMPLVTQLLDLTFNLTEIMLAHDLQIIQ
jgi:hypothetical protein